MTVVVGIRVPGQGAVLACDSRAIADSQIVTDDDVKYGFGRGLVFAAAGNASNLVAAGEGVSNLDELFDHAMNHPGQDWHLLACDMRGVHFLSYGGYRVSHQYFSAIGSGGPYALGFLDARARPRTVADAKKLARDAVKCACRRDVACGGKIRVVTL